MEDIDTKKDKLKLDIYNFISGKIHMFEAETGESIKDIQLVFNDISTVDFPSKYLLSEIHIDLVVDDNGLCIV